jgi:hypothetical protein
VTTSCGVREGVGYLHFFRGTAGDRILPMEAGLNQGGTPLPKPLCRVIVLREPVVKLYEIPLSDVLLFCSLAKFSGVMCDLARGVGVGS